LATGTVRGTKGDALTGKRIACPTLRALDVNALFIAQRRRVCYTVTVVVQVITAKFDRVRVYSSVVVVTICAHACCSIDTIRIGIAQGAFTVEAILSYRTV